MEFVIKRSEWYRGQGPRSSALLREDGKKCCLGFFAKACGYSDPEILRVGYLEQLTDDSKLMAHIEHLSCESLYDIHGIGLLYYHNDLVCGGEKSITNEADREAIIEKLFSELGFTVKFED